MSDAVVRDASRHAPAPPRFRGNSRYRFGSRIAPYVFVSPFYIIFLIFGTYPLIQALRLSFMKWAGTGDMVFVGLRNYIRLLDDERFLQALWNTTYYALGAVFLILPMAFALALAVNSALIRVKSVFRVGFILPNLTSTVASAIMFILMFNKQYGLLNELLKALGLSPIGWLDREMVKASVLLVAAWRYTGINMLYFLGGLQSIPVPVYEAAAVDGANALRKFWHITLPLLRPVAMFILITTVIGSFQFFAEPQILANGGPKDASLTITMDLYREGFTNARMGYASAIGYVLAAIIFILTLIQLKVFGSPQEGS